jgi:alpha-maltose-1-phosphate synthase
MPGLTRVALFTNEYPPNVYGGAGVHVEYLSRELARMVRVEVRCFGDQNLEDGNLLVKGYHGWEEVKRNTDPRFGGALDAFSRSLAMAKDQLDADVVHCHTWYTDMAGFLAKKLWDVPFVLTIHSLEPLRPWKVEQLGAGYHLSSWMEQTGIENADAVIAVSQETRADVLRFFSIAPEKVHVIHNASISTSIAPPRPRTRSSSAESTPIGHSCCLSVASHARRASFTSSMPYQRSIRRCRSCYAPERPTPRRSAQR